MKKFYILLSLIVLSTDVNAQLFFKPHGCSASVGPGVSNSVLSHTESRYHLLVMDWASIETSPGVFNFSTLQSQINTVKAANKKYALAISGGGTGSPAWLFSTYNVPNITYTFQSTSVYQLPLFWDSIVQSRINILANALGTQLNNDTSLALVYVTQMTANGIEGHLNGISMPTMYSAGFTPSKWINASKQASYSFANAFPNKAIAFEVHEVDTTETIPATIINDLYNDTALCHRVGAALWWLSGKTTYQTDLITVLQNYQGDKYAQLIAKSSQPWRFKDSLISTAFAQAKTLKIRYVEPWLWEYQNNTINATLNNFNAWSDSTFSYYDACSVTTGLNSFTNYMNDVIIFPNPAKGIVKISNPNSEKVTVTIFNTLGQMVGVFNGNEIDASQFPKGIYSLQINKVGGYVHKKLIIE